MLNTTGILGSRAIVSFVGRFYSPVYGHHEWEKGINAASCAIGCQSVPSDRHQGCGFHAHRQVDETVKFVSQIRGTADCVVLIECFGRVALHEKGLRSQKARIVAVADWNPRDFLNGLVFDTFPDHRNIPLLAADYFSVPLVSLDEAQSLIDMSWENYSARVSP